MLRPFRHLVFDLDGTLWRDHEPIPGAVEFVASLVGRYAFTFATNNSTMTQAQTWEKLTRLGFTCNLDQVVTSGMAATELIRSQGVKQVLVVGEEGLVQTCRDRGLEVTQDPNQAEAVLAGLDRSFSYEKLDQAMQVIRRTQRFFATNRDATFPKAGGLMSPGAGSIIAALETAGGVSPIVAGKPEPALLQLCCQAVQVAPEETLVVGDRLDTDIASGKAAGCQTFLVLTGVESEIPPGQVGGADLTAIPL